MTPLTATALCYFYGFPTGIASSIISLGVSQLKLMDKTGRVVIPLFHQIDKALNLQDRGYAPWRLLPVVHVIAHIAATALLFYSGMLLSSSLIGTPPVSFSFASAHACIHTAFYLEDKLYPHSSY
jgi:hypothetical protein